MHAWHAPRFARWLVMAAHVYTRGVLVMAGLEGGLVVVDGRLRFFPELLREAVEAFDLLTDECVTIPPDTERAAAVREAVRVVGKYVLEGAGSSAPAPKNVDVAGRLLLRSHPAPPWSLGLGDPNAGDVAVEGLRVAGREGVRLVLGDSHVVTALERHLVGSGRSARRGVWTLARAREGVTCRPRGPVASAEEAALVEIWAASGPSPEPLTVAALTPSATRGRLLGACTERPTEARLAILAHAAESTRAHRVEFPDENAFAVALERAGEGAP